MNIWLYLAYLVILAGIFALLEIQIEGGAGWAKNLPTWRISGTWLNKFTGGRDITGYHTFTNLFIFGWLHFPFILFTTWSWPLELRVLGGFLVMMVIEDFLWFVFNPHFSLKQFFAREVPWHRALIGPFPTFYYANLIIGALLIYLSFRV